MSLSWLVGLSAVLHFYIGLRLLPSLPGGWATALVLLLAVSALSTPLGLIARRLARAPLADKLAWTCLLYTSPSPRDS